MLPDDKRAFVLCCVVPFLYIPSPGELTSLRRVPLWCFYTTRAPNNLSGGKRSGKRRARRNIIQVSSWTADGGGGGRLFVVAPDKVTQAPFISRRILLLLLLLYLRTFAFIKKRKNKRPPTPLRPFPQDRQSTIGFIINPAAQVTATTAHLFGRA